MITDSEIAQFDELGAVTIDTPLTEAQVAAVSDTFDRLLPLVEPEDGTLPRFRVGMGNFFEQELLDIVQHPFFEDVAKKVLRADAVHFFQTVIITTYPTPNGQFSFDQHTDIQYSTSDLDAVPKRMICSYFLWISGVNKKRAPLMYRPGSHRLIAAEREKNQDMRNAVPTVEGVKLAQLPQLNYANAVPATARAGQVSVLTTGMVHGASVNVDTEPRKSMIITFTPVGVEIGLPENQATNRLEYNRELKQRLRPERAHIVPDG